MGLYDRPFDGGIDMFTQEDYVSIETAKMLKEKGFDESTAGFYGSKRGLCIESSLLYNSINNRINFVNDSLKVQFEDVIAAAPTLYEAQKWILVRKGILVNPIIFINGKFGIMIRGVGVFSKINFQIINPNYPTLQQALDAGIREALKNDLI